MNKIIKIIIIVALLAVFGGGFFILGFYSNRSIQYLSTAEQANRQLINQYYQPLPLHDFQQIYSVQGVISSIAADQIQIKQMPDSFTPLIPQNAAPLAISINPGTAIYYSPLPDHTRIIQPAAVNNSEPKINREIIKLQLSDLQINDRVIIRSQDNIKGQTDFTAAAIQLLK